MKNILFGLMAVTSVAFATQPDLGADVSQNSAGTVFQTGQTGEIAVHGNLQANPDIIKYVVFASTDGVYTGAADQEVYTLPDFTIAGSDSSTTPEYGFNGKTTPKVYVKRVNSSNNGVEELTNEVVSFKYNISPEWTAAGVDGTLYTDYRSGFGQYEPSVFIFVDKAELDKIVSDIGNGYRLSVGFDGQISITDGSVYYRPGKVKLRVNSDKTAEITSYEYGENNTRFPSEYIKIIETAFSTPKTSYSSLSISVKVN